MKRRLQEIKERLDKLFDKLRTNERKFEVAQNRWQNNHDLAHHEHRRQKKYEAKARKNKSEGHLKRAAWYEDKAARCKHRATKAYERAEYFVSKVKEYGRAIKKLKGLVEDNKAEAEKIETKLGPKRTGPNKIDANGHPREALKLFMHLSMQHGSRFYSQAGPSDVFHGITGPSVGHRHDCSSWFTSGYCCCGLRNPNRSAGDMHFSNTETLFTGTLGEHGEAISEGQLDTGDAILFGTAPFHHVEMKYGKMSESNATVGHGSDPIDFGITTLLPGPRAFRRYIKD